MNNQKIDVELSSLLKPSEEMSTEELTNWFAFLNAMKFANIGEDLYNKKVEEHDIPYKGILNYVQTVSGDLYQSLKINNGVPMKYSLCSNHEESKTISEVSFEVEYNK